MNELKYFLVYRQEGENEESLRSLAAELESVSGITPVHIECSAGRILPVD